MRAYRSPRVLGAALPLCFCLAAEAAAQSTEPAAAQGSATDAPIVLPPARIESDGVTQTTAGPVQGYRALTATSATRTDTSIEQIPQSIQVIDRQVIDDQDAQTISEAVRNVSGVRGVDPLEINNANFIVRGFSAEVYVDGFQLFQPQTDLESLVNVERIEVVKGPTSTLFSGGTGAPVGGIINVISKSPTPVASREIGIRGGSYDTIGGYFDINQPIAPEHGVLFRITGESQRSDAYVDRVDSWQYSFFPTLMFAPSGDTTFTVRGRYSERQTDDYSGLPAFGTVDNAPFDIRRQRFIGADNTPNTESRNASVQGKLEHRFNDIFKASLETRYLHSRFHQYSVWANGTVNAQPLLPGTSTFALASGELPQDIDALTITPNVVATFDTGPVSHTVSLGADYDRTTEDGKLDLNFLAGQIDVRDPDYPEYADPNFLLQDQRNRYTSEAIYLQEQATLWGILHVVAGGRMTRITTDTKIRPNGLGVTSTTTSSDDESEFTPRIGAVLDIAKEVSVFAGYGKGFQAPSGYVGLAAPKPEKSEQIEAGIRFNLPTGLTGSLAVYQLERENLPTVDPNTLATIQIGKERSRGIELDAIWQPLPGLSIIGNYAYTNAEIREGGTNQKGNTLPRVPTHSGRLAGNYKFQDSLLEGLSVGVGITAASSREVDDANSFSAESYYTIDANLAYEMGPYIARLSIFNLTDNEYWEPYQFLDGAIAPNRGIAAFLTLAVRF